MKQNQIGNITELVAEEGQYITQSFEAWNERQFLKKITVSPEDISKWRDATGKEKIDYERSTPPKT